MTPHNEAKKEDISNIVIMTGDPMRSKYIAENYLENYKLVNSVRAMYAYTGFYKGKRITIMSHGMGIPSMGIYCYELFKFYDVDSIIRIGSCGAYDSNLNLFDIILSENCFSEGNYALSFNNEDCHIVNSNAELNNKIMLTAQELETPIIHGNTICSDVFDPYIDYKKLLSRVPKDFNPIGAEMESFALFYIAKFFNKKASCIMSVSDVIGSNKVATSEERTTGLNKMIELALEACLKL